MTTRNPCPAAGEREVTRVYCSMEINFFLRTRKGEDLEKGGKMMEKICKGGVIAEREVAVELTF
jgi:hypothetical protein